MIDNLILKTNSHFCQVMGGPPNSPVAHIKSGQSEISKPQFIGTFRQEVCDDH
jgi:hypothetical protein